jgi:hypothetical protein
MMTCASASMMTCMITTALHDDLWASLGALKVIPSVREHTGSCRIVPQAKASRHCAACWSVSVPTGVRAAEVPESAPSLKVPDRK